MPLVLVFALKLLDRLPGAQQRAAAAGQDAFLDCGAGRMHSIVDAVLAFLYLGLGGAADTDCCSNKPLPSLALREERARFAECTLQGVVFTKLISVPSPPRSGGNYAYCISNRRTARVIGDRR